MFCGDHSTPAQAKLFEASVVSAVDHGPKATSIATVLMAVTCGLSLNNALSSEVNVLGGVHCKAGEQAVEIFHYV